MVMERKMIRFVLGSVFLMVCLAFFALRMWGHPAPQGCPVMAKCDIDGQYMSVEETYINGMHISKKYGHTYQGTNGPEHHFVIVQCQ
jgi:hypothetical protein